MIHRFILFVITIISINFVYAQCPQPIFNLDTPLCINEKLNISNTSPAGLSFEWDFCSGSALNNPTSETVVQSFTSLIPYALKKLDFNNNIYVFTLSRGSNSITKYEFGSSLANTPLITVLANTDIGGLLNSPQGFDFIFSNNQWYALVVNSDGSVIRLDFGSSLDSVPSSNTVMGASTLDTPIGIRIEVEEQNIIAAVPTGGASSPELKILNFLEDIANTPIISTISIPNGNFLRTVDIINDCGNWFAAVGGYTSGLHILNFGSSLLNSAPTITDIVGVSKPFSLKIVKDIDNFYIFSTSDDNNGLYRIGFTDSLSHLNPTITNLGDLGILNQVIGFDMFRDGQVLKGLGIGSTDRILSLTVFPKVCGSNITYSNKREPLNIYFSTPGQYYISLKATNANGVSQTSSKLVTVSASLAPQLSSQITGNCLTSPINFSGQQLSGNITNWNWDFGDGSGTSTLQNDTYAYASAGTYQIKLSVTDANGCNNLLIDTVQVYEEPIPNFTLPGGSLCMNNAIAFTNTTTGESGSAVTWTWDFNGEGASSEKEPSFTFLTPGSKTITLTSSIPGCANVTQQTINIEESPTTAFSFNNTCSGGTTIFTDETIGSNLTTWSWDFGDGVFSASQNPTHDYANPGNYIVTLTVGNNLGCTTTKVDTVYSHSIPVVNFTNDLPCSTSAIQFTDQSLVDNANMVAWEWDFGDGTLSTDQHPSHLYGQTGDFLVTLKSYSQFGCFSTNQSTVSVAQGPVVDFEWDKACQGEITSFTDLTNSFGIAITNWTWIIDGALFTNQNPTYTFSNSGIYTVQLTVTGVNLCAQTLTQDIIIEVPPVVQFGYNEACGSSGTEFYDLTNQLNDSIIAREWRVDGAVFSTDSATFTNLAPGNYAITLSVITNAGCEETTTENLTLIGSPVANFTTNATFGATPLVVNFTNLSTGGNTFLWRFGDENSSTSSEQNPSFTFEKIGVYTVTLTTESSPTCFDEFTQQIEVVEPYSSGEIIAITPITNGDKTNFLISLENSGTSTIDQSSSLVFRANYGAEVIEPINTQIYAGKKINYSASFALTSSSSTQNLCVQLRSPSKVQLDRECILLEPGIIISEPYPNPTSSLATIDVILKKESPIKVRVVNRAGQLVYTNTIDGTIGLNTITIDGNRLPQGLYIIEVILENKTEKLKLSMVR